MTAYLRVLRHSSLTLQDVARVFPKTQAKLISNSCLLRSHKLPELTKVRYPHIKRGKYAEITQADINFFRGILHEDSQVLTDEDDLLKYNTDWMGTVRGSSQIVVRPKSTQEVSEVLKYCNSRRLAVCPQGGNTGLVGGSVPVFDEVVVSTELMNKIIHLDKTSGILVCQSGCVLEKLDSHLSDHQLMMPLDLGAKGSCHIGGNVSTNAGGIRLLRYGSLHGSVLGVEAVLANGDILDCLSSLRKDNTGYDLKQLFIGSEGTLGLVSAVSILCPQKPSAVNVAFLGCDTFQQVLNGLQEAKGMLGEILSAYEFMDHRSMESVENNLGLTNPLNSCSFYILIETSGSHGPHDEEKLNLFLSKVMENGTVIDGTIATEPSKIKNLWALRERIAESLLHDGYCYKYDVSLPIDQYYNVVEMMRERLGVLAKRVVGYGHVGDGNLHFNVTSAEFSMEVKKAIEPYFYELIGSYKGSISAEHGLGFHKNKFIHYSRSETAVNVMKQLKEVFDPNGILNPYKTLPS